MRSQPHRRNDRALQGQDLRPLLRLRRHVRTLKFIRSHHGNTKDISVYGQELTATTYKLAKMNLAVRGLSANLVEVPADTFFKDQHPDLKADYVMVIS